jgi:hypothetical protein
MAASGSVTITEAMLPQIRSVPLAEWRSVTRHRWRLPVPASLWRYHGWREVVDDLCVGGDGREFQLTLYRPEYAYTRYLDWCDPIGDRLVVVFGFWDRRAVYLVCAHTGAVVRYAEILVPDEVEGDARWIYARLAGIRTAELAVATLREHTPRARRTRATVEAEAWLRRQLTAFGGAS